MILKSESCMHCDKAGYVLEYQWQRVLEANHFKLRDLPAAVLEKIPHELFYPCHCNTTLLIRAGRPRPKERCRLCDGTTWQFSHNAGGFQSSDEIHSLPCEYFERCPCDDDNKEPQKDPAEQQVFTDLPGFLQEPLAAKLGLLFP